MKLLDQVTLDQIPSRPTKELALVREEQAEPLLRRARHLLPEDHLLVVAAMELRLPVRRIAGLLNKPAATVCRRLRRLGQLLTDPFLVPILDGAVALEPENRAILIGYFLHGRTLKQLAAAHDLSVTQIARRVEYFKGWIRGAQEKGRKMKTER
jgi:DNA-directed RNA polymerase specialized sigma24 family protein